jgi:L-histidine N-alpha-methyltransferase
MFSVACCLPPGWPGDALRKDAHTGLTATPKWLPPKWFYDPLGCGLFEMITGLPEYYPARAERAILTAHADEIAAISGAHTLVELGSGSSDKTRLLLDALASGGTLRRYVPVDVSESALTGAGARLGLRYPSLPVRAIVADFERDLAQLPLMPVRPQMIAFLGSTIGNMLPPQRARFLAQLRATLGPGDTLLLGTDLVKDPATLVAAYDDAAGVTADFNKNVLTVLNRELWANFDLTTFDHVAVWDPRREWIEMRLRSARAQTVELPFLGLTATFGNGEEIRTEISAKFRRDGIAAELAAAGLQLQNWWTDPDGLYGVSLSVPT